MSLRAQRRPGRRRHPRGRHNSKVLANRLVTHEEPNYPGLGEDRLFHVDVQFQDC